MYLQTSQLPGSTLQAKSEGLHTQVITNGSRNITLPNAATCASTTHNTKLEQRIRNLSGSSQFVELHDSLFSQVGAGKYRPQVVCEVLWGQVEKKSMSEINDTYCKIRRPGSACTVFFSYVASKICHKIQNPPNPKSPNSKIQNPQSPKSKIQNPQNPKSKIPKIPKIQNPPNLGRWGPHIKICYITVQNPKSKIPKIQNPQNPKSKIPKIQNPKSEIPKSKIPNPPNPKSKIPKIQNPRKLGPHKELLHNGPKSKIQNPQNRPKKFGFWGFWILDFGAEIQNPKSPIQNPKAPKSKIQKPQDPKSKIPKIQNPKSPKSKIPKIPKIQNPKSPKSKIFRQNPKFGALGASHKDLLHNDPKSKIQNPQNPKFWILDFGFGGFWILDFGDFGFWGFWILDFGFGGFWILDLGDFGFWILGILDFGDFGAFGEVQGMYH